MGRFDFMYAVSEHLIHISVDTTDPAYEGQQNCNIYSLGANVWDLVCKWNLDVCMVKGWISKYNDYDAKQKKYFIGTGYEKKWNENISKLNPILQNFEKGGVCSSGILELNKKIVELKNDKHVSTTSIKELQLLLSQEKQNSIHQQADLRKINLQIKEAKQKIIALELSTVDICFKNDEIAVLKAENQN